jgi:hypothetical protein
MKNKEKLTQEQIKKLDDVGYSIDLEMSNLPTAGLIKFESNWEKHFEELRNSSKKNIDTDPVLASKTPRKPGID